MTGLAAAVDAVAVLGPGLGSWDEAREVLAGRRAFERAPANVPAPALLPANERRRSGMAVRIALAVGAAALESVGRDPSSVPTVFASSTADGDTCHAICEQLAGEDRMISPTRFHNSVHNAPAGYWSIATRCMSASTSLCAHDGSFVAGLLEAAALARGGGEPVLLIAYDAPYPEPLRAAAHRTPDPFGVALLLAPRAGPSSLARLELSLDPQSAPAMAEPGLEALRRDIPTARALPLLARIARGEAGEACLAYLEDLSLSVQVAPCG